MVAFAVIGFWTIVFAVGAAQGVFLCGALLLRRAGNRDATLILAALVGVATTTIMAGALARAAPARLEYLIDFLNINTELALGPLVLLFARFLVDPTRGLEGRDARHFLALGVGVAVWGLAWIVLGDPDRRLAFLAQGPVVPVYMAFKLAWLLVYLAAAGRELADSRLARVHAGGRRPVSLAWLRHAVIALGAVAVALYAIAFADRLGLDLPVEPDPLGSLILALMIYLISLMVLQRPWILALRARPRSGEHWAEEAARLAAYLDSERPWLRPDLTLAELAQALGTTESRLSVVLREGMDTGFYALLSRYRLAEFERLARDPARENRSVLELAYEAGFNSKASFYRAFRQEHGTTPTAFRRSG